MLEAANHHAPSSLRLARRSDRTSIAGASGDVPCRAVAAPLASVPASFSAVQHPTDVPPCMHRLSSHLRQYLPLRGQSCGLQQDVVHTGRQAALGSGSSGFGLVTVLVVLLTLKQVEGGCRPPAMSTILAMSRPSIARHDMGTLGLTFRRAGR